MSQIEVPDMTKFRTYVEAIPHVRDRTLIEALYLTASREAELTTKTNPFDLLHHASKPYGVYLNFKITDFEISPPKGDKAAVSEKVLLITEAVAKRMKRHRKDQPDKPEKELTTEAIAEKLPVRWREKYLREPQSIDPLLVNAFLGKLTFKMIALPCTPKYEPWTRDLLLHIKKTGTISFNLTRKSVWRIYRQHLAHFLPKKSLTNLKNPLRHWRISHLIEHFSFDPYELTVYAGWTFKTTFGQMGIQASPNIDIYAHLQWKRYFPKLLREF